MTYDNPDSNEFGFGSTGVISAAARARRRARARGHSFAACESAASPDAGRLGSGCVGGGDGQRVVVEIRHDVEPTAKRLDISHDGVECRDLATLDL